MFKNLLNVFGKKTQTEELVEEDIMEEDIMEEDEPQVFEYECEDCGMQMTIVVSQNEESGNVSVEDTEETKALIKALRCEVRSNPPMAEAQSVIPRFMAEQVEKFDQILALRTEAFLAGEDADEIEDDDDLFSLKMNIANDLFHLFVPDATKGESEYFALEYANYVNGTKTLMTVDHGKADALAPVCGVNLETFAKVSAKIGAGEEFEAALTAFGLTITPEQWTEVNRVWMERMQADYEISMIYSRYFMENHDDTVKSDVEKRLFEDREFFQQVYAMRDAAYAAERDLDGAQIVMEKFNITTAVLQQAWMFWKEDDSKYMREEILTSPEYKEIFEEYRKNFRVPDGGKRFDAFDFGAGMKVMDFEELREKLGSQHFVILQILKKSMEDLDEIGDFLVYEGDVMLTDDFSTQIEELFPEDKLEDYEDIESFVVLGDLVSTGNIDVGMVSDFIVDGNIKARSISATDPSVFAVSGSCQAERVVFVGGDEIKAVTIQGEIKAPVFFTALSKDTNISLGQIGAEVKGIVGYLNDDEIGTIDFMKKTGMEQVITTNDLSKFIGYIGDPTHTEDIVSELMDGDIVF